MKLILQAIKALFRKIEARIDNAQTAADNAKTTAYNARTAANNAQTAANNAQTAANNAKTTANNAKTTADNAKTTADNAKTTANNAYTVASKAVKLVNVTIPKSMVIELVTLLNGLQTGERGKVTHDGRMFSIAFYTGGNVLAKLEYSTGPGFYIDYMLMNSTDGYKALGFLHWDYSHTGTDTKIFFIQLRNSVSISYIEAIRLA